MFIKISGMCIDCISSFYITKVKYLRLGNFEEKKLHLVHSSGGLEPRNHI